ARMFMLLFLLGAGYLAKGVLDYFEFVKAANAIGAYPWTDASSKISYVQPGCTRSCMGKCCCAMCDASCEGSTQVNFMGQKGSTFACIPPSVVPKGGGTMPMINGSIILAGVSPVMVTAEAIPTAAASRVIFLVEAWHKIVNWIG
ncbi:hypothetical protein HGA64_02975, partial [Candidatus Falkowbacteria bacterium]|nr:hypothetical protein [Candidatus Falkowbacteria bacterium]